MSLPYSVETYMHKNNIRYNSIPHKKTETALANSTKIQCSASDMAKVVAFNLDGMNALFVLPSNEKIHIPTIRDELRVRHVHMLNEAELKTLFRDCEVGAMPAMGSMYKMPTFLSKHLKDHYSIYFNGGTHTDIIQMETQDYIKTERPEIFDFSVAYRDYESYQADYLHML